MRKGLASPLPAGCLRRVRSTYADRSGSTVRLPAGTQGSAAVYTGTVQIVGVIRMALMRATSWTNYLCFTA